LELKDIDLLLYLQSILDRSKNEDVYQLSEEELQILNESKADYNAERAHYHEDVMKEMKAILKISSYLMKLIIVKSFYQNFYF